MREIEVEVREEKVSRKRGGKLLSTQIAWRYPGPGAR